MMARDVKDKLREMGFERGTAHILAVILEEQSAMRQQFKEMSQLLDKMTDIIMNFTSVAEQMKKQHDEFRQKFGERDHLPPPV